MDFRKLMQKYTVNQDELSAKVKLKIKKFNDSLKMRNMCKDAKKVSVMDANLELMNEDLVEDISFFIHERDGGGEAAAAAEAKRVADEEAARKKAEDDAAAEAKRISDEEAAKNKGKKDDDDEEENTHPFKMFGYR
jgi:hypothetical protein